MGAPAELIGLYWTTSGPVEVHFGREWSLFDLRDRCEQAARVGFAGLGLWHADLEHVLETRTLREVRQLLDDNGLRHLELEFLGDWFLDPGRRAPQGVRRATGAAVRGGRGPSHAPHQGGQHRRHGVRAPEDRRALRRALRRRGALHRRDDRLRVHAVRRQRERRREGARRRRGGERARTAGLALDTWHLGKLRLEPDDLRRIPPRFLSWVELCDGPYEYAEDRLDEVINRRKLPGEGEFPLQGYVAVCRELGYDGPWGVEVLSEELRSLPIEQIFDRAYETTIAQLAAASERSLGG